MGQRAPFAPGEIYHVYNRGTERRNIFLRKKDYERFMALLYLSNSSIPVRLDNISRSEQGSTLLTSALAQERGETLVNIGAYCLMPNHFHLLVREKEDGGISHFMQKLTTAYTMYFNTRNERTGALFQGKFKAQHVVNERHLKYLFSYIHLNPSKLMEPTWRESGVSYKRPAERFLENYHYSSYGDFAGQIRTEAKILNKEAFPLYFETPREFKHEIATWVDYRKDG